MPSWFGSQQQAQGGNRILSEIGSVSPMMSFVLLRLVALADGC